MKTNKFAQYGVEDQNTNQMLDWLKDHMRSMPNYSLLTQTTSPLTPEAYIAYII